MITETNVSDTWPLSGVNDIHLLKQSGKRRVFRLNSEQGKYIVKIADSSKDREKIIKDTEILRFFEAASYPAPRLLQTRKGDNFIEDDEGFIYSISFIEGSEPEKNIANYAQLGEITARLHAVDGYKTSTDFTAITEIPRMLARANKFNVDSRYAELVNLLPDFEPLPQCLIHTDIGSHNSIQQSDGQIILVDWDDAGIGTRILDLGFPLICDFMTNELVFEEDRAKAFYQAYSSRIELTDTEKKYLFDAGMFYALSYTIFDDSGFVEGQWRKVLAALEMKDEILACLPA